MLITTYPGQAFHPDLAQHSVTGTLRFDSLYMLFSAPEIELKLPLQGLQLREGGMDSMIFFSHPNIARCEVCTKDRRILQEAALLKNPAIAVQIRQIKRSGLTVWALIAVTALLLTLLGWGLMTGFSSLSQAVVRNIPVEWEKTLGEASFAQIKQEQKILSSPELEWQLKNFTTKLTDSIKDKRYPFQIAVVQSSELNAFALPGGYIIINSALLEKADRGEEVLGVLAHEIAHVTRQHGLQNIVKSAGLYLTVQALFGDSSGLLQVFTDAAPMLLVQKYSRDFEREADWLGLEYLLAAHIDPQGMISFFEKLQESYQDTAVAELEHSLNWLSTHPATGDRIAELKAQIANLDLPQTQDLSHDFQQLKQALAQIPNP